MGLPELISLDFHPSQYPFILLADIGAFSMAIYGCRADGCYIERATQYAVTTFQLANHIGRCYAILVGKENIAKSPLQKVLYAYVLRLGNASVPVERNVVKMFDWGYFRAVILVGIIYQAEAVNLVGESLQHPAEQLPIGIV